MVVADGFHEKLLTLVRGHLLRKDVVPELRRRGWRLLVQEREKGLPACPCRGFHREKRSLQPLQSRLAEFVQVLRDFTLTFALVLHRRDARAFVPVLPAEVPPRRCERGGHGVVVILVRKIRKRDDSSEYPAENLGRASFAL